MATNFIEIEFELCEPTPVNGYRFLYRPLGSEIAYRGGEARFFSSPAQITDELDPEGTEYEGILQADCGNGVFSNGINWQTAPGGGSDSDSGGGGSDSDSGGVPIEPNWWIHGGRWNFFQINLTGPINMVGPLTAPADGNDVSHQGTIDWAAIIAANPGVQVNVAVETPIEDLDCRIRIYDLTDSVYIHDGASANAHSTGFIPVAGHEYLIEGFDGLDSPEHILF